PTSLDLRFDFVETAVAGRCDPRDIVPDEAAARQRQRLVVDADVRAECRRDDVGTGRQILDRRAVRRTAGAIRLEVARSEFVLLRDLVEVQSRRAVVLDLIAKIEQLRAGTLDRNLLFDGGRDFLVRARVSRLDLDDVRQNGPEPPGNRRADAAVRKREVRIRHRTVDELVLRDEPEIEILWFETALLCKIRKGGTLGQAVRRGTGLVRIREHDLFDPALLRSAVAVPVLLVLLANVLFGNFNVPGEVLGRERQDRDLAVFGRAELGLVLLVIFRESFRRGCRDVAGPCAVERDIVDGALLVLKAIDGIRQRFWRSEAAAYRIDDLAAKRDASLLGRIARLGKACGADHLLEAELIELSGRAGEILVRGDLAGDLRVGKIEPELARALVERGFGHELAQQLPLEAERSRLIARDGAAELAAELLQVLAVGVAELLDADLGRADLRQARAAEAAGNVADAPPGEGQR